VSGRPEPAGEAAVRLDRERCVGAGQCVRAAPEVFDQDEEGFGVVLRPRVSGAARHEAAEARLLCPVRAVELAERE